MKVYFSDLVIYYFLLCSWPWAAGSLACAGLADCWGGCSPGEGCRWCGCAALSSGYCSPSATSEYLSSSLCHPASASASLLLHAESGTSSGPPPTWHDAGKISLISMSHQNKQVTIHLKNLWLTCWASCCLSRSSLFFSSRSSWDFLPSWALCSSRACMQVFSSPPLQSCSLATSSRPLRAFTSSWSSHCCCLPHL